MVKSSKGSNNKKIDNNNNNKSSNYNYINCYYHWQTLLSAPGLGHGQVSCDFTSSGFWDEPPAPAPF